MNDVAPGLQKRKGRGRRITRMSVFTVLMLLTTLLLIQISNAPLVQFSPFGSDVVNRMLSYQLSALLVAGIALLVTFASARRIRLGYLSLRRTGAMRPILGRSGDGRWETDAWPLGLLMVAIVGVATFVQLLPGGFTFHWAYVALAVPFAAMNAFTEEAIFRLPYVTMGDDSTDSRAYGLIMGTLVFGVIHFWGVAPNGLAGAVMSAFLGFFLAKSIQETKGIFWAFAIHFALNLVGMSLILNATP